MMRKVTLMTALLVLPLLALTLSAQETSPAGGDMPFGGGSDVAFGRKLWNAIDGYENWKLTSSVYKGASPHGKYVRLFSTWVTVDKKSYPIIIKENYGGRGVTKERIEEDRNAWLKAITIMLQREPGYDADNQNWFWVKYAANGTIEKNAKGMQLAGRVAKGMPKGCISCHLQAGGSDYLFSNDG